MIDTPLESDGKEIFGMDGPRRRATVTRSVYFTGAQMQRNSVNPDTDFGKEMEFAIPKNQPCNRYPILRALRTSNSAGSERPIQPGRSLIVGTAGESLEVIPRVTGRYFHGAKGDNHLPQDADFYLAY